MYHLNTSYIPITYCDTLHSSASAGDPHTYYLLLTVHQYKVCKHKRTWIRLILMLPELQL